MKLNLDCVRDVLLFLEKHQSFDDGNLMQDITVWKIHDELPKYSFEDILYTCQKLDEGGFISYTDSYASNALYHACVSYITYQGHQFLESIRPEDVYKKTKSTLKKIGSFGLDTAKDVASKVIAELINSQMGIN